jgi:hypothetical protein
MRYNLEKGQCHMFFSVSRGADGGCGEGFEVRVEGVSGLGLVAVSTEGGPARPQGLLQGSAVSLPRFR